MPHPASEGKSPHPNGHSPNGSAANANGPGPPVSPWPRDQQGDASEDAPQPDPATEPTSEDNAPQTEPTQAPVPILPCLELLRRYPDLRPAVIEGLLRQGETLNLIAAPKVGKSWLTLGL